MSSQQMIWHRKSIDNGQLSYFYPMHFITPAISSQNAWYSPATIATITTLRWSNAKYFVPHAHALMNIIALVYDM